MIPQNKIEALGVAGLHPDKLWKTSSDFICFPVVV
jgi:hypothetical protein